MKRRRGAFFELAGIGGKRVSWYPEVDEKGSFF